LGLGGMPADVLGRLTEPELPVGYDGMTTRV
jgi:hypothetical protein